MNTKYPFARRITTAFVLMTAVVSGLFSLGIVVVVNLVETRLISEELQNELHYLIDNQVLFEQMPDLTKKNIDHDLVFFSSAHEKDTIPFAYRKLPAGFTELDQDEQSYVYILDKNGERYVIVRNQEEFETYENTLFRIVAVGFVLSILASWLLGLLMAKRVMTPVIRLAQQVRHRDQLHPSAPPLAPSYPSDEVGQLAAAFDATLGKLHAYLEREQLFTSDVSHELRTPLMVISTSCELLSETTLSSAQRERLQRVRRATDQIGSLVQTFLMLARAKQGSTLERNQTDLSGAATAQKEQWTPLMQEKGLKFTCTVESADNGLYSATLLNTVIANLLRNALHYTDQGEVRLVLSQGAFRVEDSGPGIPSEQQIEMFTPFVRGSHARGEGLGLGLSLVKRICNHEGWSVELTTRQPSGCRFHVQLQPPA